MTRERLRLPEQNVREYAHGLAEKLVREQLAAIGDIRQQCLKSGARYDASGKAAVIDYLNRSYRISLPQGEVSFTDSRDTVPMRDKILILDYFTRARGTALAGRAITYKELRDGINYFSVFAKRAITPLVTYFGGQPERLIETAAALGGQKAGYGDAAVTIDAFPRVPVTLVLWRGDDEFPSEGSIMFDSTVADYLTNDDIHALCENIAWTLVRLLKNGGDTPGKR